MVPSFSQDTEESIEEESMEIAKQSMNLLDSNNDKETSDYECFNICQICRKDQTNYFGSRFSKMKDGQARATIVQAGCQAQG